MPKPEPLVVLRPRVVQQRYIPVGHTVLGELIDQGLLEVVPLTPKGRAEGITLKSVVRYQRKVMGLELPPDDTLDTAPRIAERDRTDRNT
jgi:hypothetical protein